MTEAQTRSIQVTEVDAETREFVGIFAPYDEVITYAGKQERYERGLFADADLVDLHYNHGKAALGGDMPIGEVVEYIDTDAGLSLRGRFYETARGDEAYKLTKAGTLNSLSANFIPTRSREEEDVTVWEAAYLDEVSLVRKPAYPSAKISEVRSDPDNTNKTKEDSNESHTMSEIIDTEARSGLADLERRFEVLSTETPATAPAEHRSAGEFVKALAAGDDNAKAQIRAYTGATLSDSHANAAWQNDLLKIVDNGRPLVNLFDRGPLPATGMSIAYPKVGSLTGSVGKQAAEGDNLNYLEVGITTASADVNTYGGYSEISRQAIERSDVSYLDAVLKFQAAEYAKATNKAVSDAIAAATPQAGTTFGLAAATGQSFINAVTDGVQKIADNGLGATPDFVMVSADVYAKLAGLVDSAIRPLFNINVRGIAGSLAGLPVVVVPGLAVRTFYVASSQAVMVWENAGAPVRLEDENIVNLTKQFSLYGHLAVGVKNAAGLVKATVNA